MTHVTKSRSFDVLLVDDNPGDVDLVRYIASSNDSQWTLHSVSDGVAAVAYLRREPPHADAPRPDLVLLDLNLPKLQGLEVIATIKQDPSLRLIPIIVLTSSVAERDVHQAYALGANCYIGKPVGLQELQRVLASLEHFWGSIVRLPNPR